MTDSKTCRILSDRWAATVSYKWVTASSDKWATTESQKLFATLSHKWDAAVSHKSAAWSVSQRCDAAVSHTYTNWFEHMAHSKSLAFAYTLHVHSVCAHRPHLIQIVITTVRLILPPVSSGVFTYAQYGQHGSGVHTEGNTLALPASAASIH